MKGDLGFPPHILTFPSPRVFKVLPSSLENIRLSFLFIAFYACVHFELSISFLYPLFCCFEFL